MKDETKEILEDKKVIIDQHWNYIIIGNEKYYDLPKRLLDYITNLQEEAKKYKEYLKNRNKECNSLEAELYLYKDNNKYLNNKIDKALKYFDENYFDFDDDRCKAMEEILTIDTPPENLYKYTPEKGFRLVGDDLEGENKECYQ